MKFIKKNWMTILCATIFIIGLSLVLYPSVSNYWNSFHQTKAIASYEQKVSEMDSDDTEKMWKAAEEYNEKLAQKTTGKWSPTKEEHKEYENLLNVGGVGVMGSVEIPKIKVSLPIYHGVEQTILQIAIGHIEGSSLPVGGKSTHCVISGHRGLPSAKLFTDLDKLEKGDIFKLQVLNETLTYEVDQIRIVLPNDLDDLNIIEGEDLCTLVTCTPYGINTHRLLVRGHRIPNVDDGIVKTNADAAQIAPTTVALAIAGPILAIWLLWIIIKTRKRNANRGSGAGLFKRASLDSLAKIFKKRDKKHKA